MPVTSFWHWASRLGRVSHRWLTVLGLCNGQPKRKDKLDLALNVLIFRRMFSCNSVFTSLHFSFHLIIRRTSRFECFRRHSVRFLIPQFRYFVTKLRNAPIENDLIVLQVAGMELTKLLCWWQMCWWLIESMPSRIPQKQTMSFLCCVCILLHWQETTVFSAFIPMLLIEYAFFFCNVLLQLIFIWCLSIFRIVKL